MLTRSQRIDQAVKHCCPTCGGPLDANAALRVDLDTNTLYGYGAAIKVSPRHAEMAHFLAGRFPGTVERYQLIHAIWGEQEISDKLLDVVICLTRRYLERVGYSIKNEYGQGYRLVRL